MEKTIVVDGVYRLVKKLGQGGMATVFLAEVDHDRFDYTTLYAYTQVQGDTHTARRKNAEQFARKLLMHDLDRGTVQTILRASNIPLPADRAAVKIATNSRMDNRRFEGEWKNLLCLNHPNVIKVYGGGTFNKRPYYAMELLEGMVKPVHIVDGLTILQKLQIIVDAARGLGYLHDNGLVHRDVKPDNLLTCRESTGGHITKVADLGIVKNIEDEAGATMAETVIGTPHYMAPEQIRSSRDVDARADIYALGATLYHLVTGHKPYEDQTTVYGIIGAVSKQEASRPPPSHWHWSRWRSYGSPAEALFARARQAHDRGDFDVALALLDRAAELSGDPDGVGQLIEAVRKAQRQDELLEGFRNLSREGEALARRGEWPAAVQALTRALGTASQLREAPETLAAVQNRLHAASEALQKEQRQQESLTLYRTYLEEALVAESEARWDEARQRYEQARAAGDRLLEKPASFDTLNERVARCEAALSVRDVAEPLPPVPTADAGDRTVRAVDWTAERQRGDHVAVAEDGQVLFLRADGSWRPLVPCEATVAQAVTDRTHALWFYPPVVRELDGDAPAHLRPSMAERLLRSIRQQILEECAGAVREIGRGAHALVRAGEGVVRSDADEAPAYRVAVDESGDIVRLHRDGAWNREPAPDEMELSRALNIRDHRLWSHPDVVRRLEGRAPADLNFVEARHVLREALLGGLRRYRPAFERIGAASDGLLTTVSEEPRTETEAAETTEDGAAADRTGPARRLMTGVQAIHFSGEGGGALRIQTERHYPSITYWDDEGHWVEWTVRVPSDGVYMPVFVYATQDGPVRRALAVDGSMVIDRLEFPHTGGWGVRAEQWRVERFEHRLRLRAGTRRVRMMNLPPGGGLNLAWILFVSPDVPREAILQRVAPD